MKIEKKILSEKEIIEKIKELQPIIEKETEEFLKKLNEIYKQPIKTDIRYSVILD